MISMVACARCNMKKPQACPTCSMHSCVTVFWYSEAAPDARGAGRCTYLPLTLSELNSKSLCEVHISQQGHFFCITHISRTMSLVDASWQGPGLR